MDESWRPAEKYFEWSDSRRRRRRRRVSIRVSTVRLPFTNVQERRFFRRIVLSASSIASVLRNSRDSQPRVGGVDSQPRLGFPWGAYPRCADRSSTVKSIHWGKEKVRWKRRRGRASARAPERERREEAHTITGVTQTRFRWAPWRILSTSAREKGEWWRSRVARAPVSGIFVIILFGVRTDAQHSHRVAILPIL